MELRQPHLRRITVCSPVNTGAMATSGGFYGNWFVFTYVHGVTDREERLMMGACYHSCDRGTQITTWFCKREPKMTAVVFSSFWSLRINIHINVNIIV